VGRLHGAFYKAALILTVHTNRLNDNDRAARALHAGPQDDFPLLPLLALSPSSVPLALIPGGARGDRSGPGPIGSRARRAACNPICKYFSHLKAEINDSRGKSSRFRHGVFCRFNSRFFFSLRMTRDAFRGSGTRRRRTGWCDFSDAYAECPRSRICKLRRTCRARISNIHFKGTTTARRRSRRALNHPCPTRESQRRKPASPDNNFAISNGDSHKVGKHFKFLENTR